MTDSIPHQALRLVCLEIYRDGNNSVTSCDTVKSVGRSEGDGELTCVICCELELVLCCQATRPPHSVSSANQ